MKKCIKFFAEIGVIAFIVFFFHYTALFDENSCLHIGELIQKSLYGYYSGMGPEMQMLAGEGLLYIMIFVFWSVPDIWEDFVYVQDFRFCRIASRAGWLTRKILVIIRRAFLYNIEVWGMIFLFSERLSMYEVERRDFVLLLMSIIYCVLTEVILVIAGQFITVVFNLRIGLPMISVIVLALFTIAGLKTEGHERIKPLWTWLNPMDLCVIHSDFYDEMIKILVLFAECSAIIIAFYEYVNRMNILKRGK